MTPRQPPTRKERPTAVVGHSVASQEFLDLAGRVLDGRAAYRAEGLSARGTRVLQALGYLAPFDLFGTIWAARPGDPGLHIRAKAVPGCGAATLRDLEAWLSRPWGRE